MKKFKKSKGVTLIELLVILAIIALLILAAIFTWRLQLSKGRDAKRKADLHHLQNILEDYYNDHNAYPPDPPGLDCGGSLLPYLQEIYCDPSGQPYFYQVADDDSYYRIYAEFENKNDPGIEEVGCLGGCGPGCQYDFGVASQNTNLEVCEICELPNLPAIGPGGMCPPGLCMQCPGEYVCLPQGNCCRPRELGECL